MGRRVLAIVFSLAAASARAQSPYVAGTIGADLTRVSHSTSTLSPTASGDSEVFSGSLRVGTSVGESWGVELEYVQSAEGRGEIPTGIPIYATALPTPAGLTLPNIPIPAVGFETDVRRSRSDYDAVAWVRQRISGSVDLDYLGGVAFSRQRIEITQTFPTLFSAVLPRGGGTFRTTTVTYGTRPLVGAEARIGLTSHMRLVPGIRLQGAADGWLVRPYVGIGWFF